MKENIAVTVCSINYLAHAKGLADSMVKHNPNYKVVIGLVDKLADGFDRSAYYPHRLLEVEEMKLPEFEQMYKRYNTFELNCALKSFFVRYSLDEYKPDWLVYMDVDMLVLDSFLPIENMLKEFSILITPHITKPFPDDGLKPAENDILKTGMFNAGFFAVKNDEVANTFINWWRSRMVDQGYERPRDGYNADQNWLNFAPLYFDKVKTVRHPGCNVAYWNLHERVVEKKEGRFLSNGEPLFLYHFSGYSVDHPDKISRHQQRFSLQANAALKELFGIYHETLLKNRYETLHKIPCYYKKESSSNWLSKLGLKK